jgi:hypothetical protein
MKLFNSIRELWDYCLFCPLCQNSTRGVSISVGPEPVISLTDYIEPDQNIELRCLYKYKLSKYKLSNYKITFTIDLDTNRFETNIHKVDIPEPAKAYYGRTSKPYFYFYVQGHCYQCGLSSTYSTDLELDILNRKISNIGLEADSFVIADGNHRLVIETYYDTNTMSVHLDKLPLSDGGFTDDKKAIQLPMRKLDFSDKDKLIHRIQTMITFS